MGIAIINHFQNVDSIGSKFEQICDLSKTLTAVSKEDNIETLGGAEYASIADKYAQLWFYGSYALNGFSATTTSTSNAFLTIYFGGTFSSYNTGTMVLKRTEYTKDTSNQNYSGTKLAHLDHQDVDSWDDWKSLHATNSACTVFPSDCVYFTISANAPSKRVTSWTGGSMKLKVWGRGLFSTPV